MAVNPSPLILETDQFLLNREGATYKTPFTNLAENVLNLVLEGDQNGDSLIHLTDLFDVNTDTYIKERDAVTGAPTITASRAADGVDISEKFWLLQHVNPLVSREDGETQRNEFVLADPKDLFSELKTEIDATVTNLELNSLRDVTTRLGVEPGANFTPHFVNDSFLLCVSAGVATGDVETEILPDYQPRRLSRVVSDLLEDNKIIIDIETNVDVNPIFFPAPTPENPTGVEPAQIRLEVNEEYKNGVPGSVKYTPVLEAKNFDDILVYLTGKLALDNCDPYIGVLYDKDGNDLSASTPTGVTFTQLPAGWYYAENISDGSGKLEPADLANDEEVVDDNIKLGGVRVLKYKDSVLVDNPDTGDLKVQTVGTVPTNIGITEDGVLYSSIPNTLSFIQTIDITPDGSEYFFYNGTASVSNIPVANVGPLDATNGEPWNNENASAIGPNVGDFYVIRMVPTDAADPNTGLPADDSIAQATINWNTVDGTATTPDPLNQIDGNGEALIVKNGDMVAFGGKYWSVIGSVNTDTVAQDLQNVTTRGNFSTKGIQLRSLEGNGLVVGGAHNYEEGRWETLTPSGAVTQTYRLETNHINFDYIRDLSEAGQPLPNQPPEAGFPLPPDVLIPIPQS